MAIYETTSGDSLLDIFEHTQSVFLLLETGGYLLLETGGRILLEGNSPNYDVIYELTSS